MYNAFQKRAVICLRRSFICCCICKFYKLKNCRKCICSIKIIIHGRFKFGNKTFCLFEKRKLFLCNILCRPIVFTVAELACRLKDTLQRVLCCLHQICAEVQRTSVMCVQHKETENLKIILFTDLTNGTKFPRDLDILRLSMFRKPLCIQYLAKILPLQHSLCAISFS